MGNYIYALRSPSHCRLCIVTLTGDKQEQVKLLIGSMSYLYKPTWDPDSKFNRTYERISTKISNIWRYGSIKPPKYVAFTQEHEQSRIKVDDKVFEWPGHEEVPLLYNDGSELLKLIGTVTKIMRRS